MLSLPKVTRAVKHSGYRLMVAAIGLLLASGTFMYVTQRAEALRFTDRSLYINSSIPGKTTFYTITFTYPTNSSVGSVRMLFCKEAIPALPCDPPAGLNVSNAVLSTQTGATGFTLTSQTTNSLVISRPAIPTGITESKYTFTNVVNPTEEGTFYVRLNSYTSTDASGPFIDFGSVASSVQGEIGLHTHIPPILIFCAGKEIPTLSCADIIGPNEEHFGDFDPTSPLTTKNDLMAYTNVRTGYTITYAGRTLTSGIYELPAIVGDPQVSIPGKAQFGINLAVNTDPAIGDVPAGPGTNATVNSDYTTPDLFQFNPGEILVTSDDVTLNRRFTVSYIINTPPDQHPGVYSTTVTYICTTNF